MSKAWKEIKGYEGRYLISSSGDVISLNYRGSKKTPRKACLSRKREKDGNVIKEWENTRTIFVETGMSDWSIAEVCRGNRHTAYGYLWRYANEDIVREN